jgi:hypothetical protein
LGRWKWEDGSGKMGDGRKREVSEGSGNSEVSEGSGEREVGRWVEGIWMALDKKVR